MDVIAVRDGFGFVELVRIMPRAFAWGFEVALTLI